MGISSATKYFRAPDAQCANYLDKSLFEWRPRPGWPSSRSYPETGKKGGVGHPDVGDPVDSIAQPSKGGAGGSGVVLGRGRPCGEMAKSGSFGS